MITCEKSFWKNLEMMQHAAIGVTLENAPDDVKAIADYVTDRYDEDGFAKAVEKLILKEG